MQKLAAPRAKGCCGLLSNDGCLYLCHIATSGSGGVSKGTGMPGTALQ